MSSILAKNVNMAVDERAKRRCVKILGVNRDVSVRVLFDSLKFMNVKQQIIFRTLLFIYKIVKSYQVFGRGLAGMTNCQMICYDIRSFVGQIREHFLKKIVEKKGLPNYICHPVFVHPLKARHHKIN